VIVCECLPQRLVTCQIMANPLESHAFNQPVHIQCSLSYSCVFTWLHRAGAKNSLICLTALFTPDRRREGWSVREKNDEERRKDRKHVMEKMYRVSCVLAWSQMCLCCLASSYGYYHGNHTSWPCSTVRSRTRLEYMDVGNGSKHWKLAMSTIHSKTSMFLKST
jgi:hypothetical protein